MTVASYPPSSSPPDGLPPLDDPYFVAPAPAPPRERASFLAGASVLTAIFLGPVGAIAAIVFGWAARREIAASGKQKSAALATIGMALGVLLSIAWGAGLSLLIWETHYRDAPVAYDPEPADREPDPPAHSPPSHAATTPSASADPGPAGTVPKSTVAKKLGVITVVDVGVATSTLGEELAKQRAEAASAGEQLLVMTTKEPCAPCRGFDDSLRDPLVQTALAKVRLVRVDVDVFRDDLEQLKIPSARIPGFYLLSLDLTPKDGIDGGEWDDDIPQNIAPVLGAFVRGKYTTRRQTWQPLPGTGIRL